MLKPITLHPIAYLSLLLANLLFIVYLMLTFSGQNFAQIGEKVTYKSIIDLLKDIKYYQGTGDYHAIIDTLNRVDIDTLVSGELTNGSPRVVAFSSAPPIAPGLEKPGDFNGMYASIAFPDTADTTKDPHRDYWILWARAFAARYNTKLEAELKQANQKPASR